MGDVMEPRNLLHYGQAQRQSYDCLAGNEPNLLNGLKQTPGTMLLEANDSNRAWRECEADSGLGICCATSIIN